MKGKRFLLLSLLATFFAFLLINITYAAQMGELSEEPQALAFPKNMAGMAAWIKLDKSIDLPKVASVFEQAVEIGKNYVLGYKNISIRYPGRYNHSLNVKVHLYADNQGYIVAFLDKNTPAAAMVDFGEIDFELGKIKNFSLTEVIKEATTKLGIPNTFIDKKVKFYNFAYPEANKFAIIIGQTKARNKKYIHILVPYTFNKVYEVSLLFSESYGYCDIDEKRWSSSSKYEKLDLDKQFVIGRSHTISFYEHTRSDTAAVALVIIYKE